MTGLRRVVCLWSGGIDSTALLLGLLRRRYEVIAVSLAFERGKFMEREARARATLRPMLGAFASDRGGRINFQEADCAFLLRFAADGAHHIDRRNKLLLEYLIATVCIPSGIRNVGMGEYVGVDTWVVQDHVAGSDCDHRALSSWLFTEFGYPWRLISLADFGESRFKVDRLAIGIGEGSAEIMGLTTNCLTDSDTDCGSCYKCVERSVAFHLLDERDPTGYAIDPKQSPMWAKYLAQMGESAILWQPFSNEEG